MEKKLEEYRARKRREKMFNNAKQHVKSFLSFNNNKLDQYERVKVINSEELGEEDDTLEDCDQDSEASFDDNAGCFTYTQLIFYGLCFTLWAILFVVFIKLQFGAIYFIITGLIFICFNTRTGKKKNNEISAYSVFNKNCESIDGTLKAEQLERQMIYGRLT